MKQESLNAHMGLFHFFSENREPKYIENNLTRALAICISEDKVFQYAFLKQIFSKEDFDKLFYTYEEDSAISVNLQVETSSIVDDTRTLYAVGLTDDTTIHNWADLTDDIEHSSNANYTDMVITIKDVKIIIEVKRTGENCKEQLKRQIAPFVSDSDDKTLIVPMHINWVSVLTTMEQVNNFYLFNKQRSLYLNSFIDIVNQRFGHWTPTKPFNVLSFYKDKSESQRRYDLDRRLLQAVHSIGVDKIQSFWDRTAINIDRPWATEAIPEFQLGSDGKPYLALRIWPGNTKQQGHSLYNKSLDWTKNKFLEVNGQQLELVIERHIKFMHFNKYVTSIDVPMVETDAYLNKEINTTDNHYHKLAGKWHRDQWPELERQLDEHFKVNWRKSGRCEWENEFINSDRSYLTISLGYTINMYIPYETLTELDKVQDGYKSVGKYLVDCKDAIVDMVEKQ